MGELPEGEIAHARHRCQEHIIPDDMLSDLNWPHETPQPV
jgi:hypothetical protein